MRLTNKFSNNLMARHLLLTLGEERYGPPATIEKGADAIADWARTRGLALPGLEIDNGSGLSRATRISALEMANILEAAFHSRYAPEFMASLPLAGIDGTLRSRMPDTAAGSVRLKTGHIDGVSGVAGYVAGAAGRTYCWSRSSTCALRPTARPSRFTRRWWIGFSRRFDQAGRSRSQRIAAASLRSHTPKPR